MYYIENIEITEYSEKIGLILLYLYS